MLSKSFVIGAGVAYIAPHGSTEFLRIMVGFVNFIVSCSLSHFLPQTLDFHTADFGVLC